jgi:hypothetical protein
MAGKVVVDCVGLYVVVIRVGDAAEYSRFSLEIQVSRPVVERSRIVMSGLDRMGRSSARRVLALA